MEDLAEVYDDILIRKLRADETALLKDFLYEAIFIPEDAEPPARVIVELPELRLYYEDFGRGAADNCLVAESDGQVVGAVWTRIMDDYGHVDDETPSFAISLLPKYRNMGIGTRLMKDMLALLAARGFRRASLAVQKANYVRMYKNVGFEIADENDEEFIMVWVVCRPKKATSGVVCRQVGIIPHLSTNYPRGRFFSAPSFRKSVRAASVSPFGGKSRSNASTSESST